MRLCFSPSFLHGLALLLCLPAFAQTNFKPGYLELLTAEKVQGQISVGNGGSTPKTIFFRNDDTTAAQPYTPAQIKGFGIDGGDSYLSQIVQVDLLPVSRREALPEGSEKAVQDTVFLKQLVAGPVLSLYELTGDKPHYYLKKPDGGIVELLYKVFRRKDDQNLMQGEDNIVYQNIFRDQLRVYAFADESVLYNIDHSAYTAADLSKAVTAVNFLSSEEYKRPEKAVKRIFIGGGPTFSNHFTMTGTTFQQFKDLKSKNELGFLLKVNADFFGKKDWRNAFLRTEINFSHFDYQGHFDYPDQTAAVYYLTMNTLSATASIAYNVVHTKNLQAYAAAGTGINYSFYPTNRIVNTSPIASWLEDWRVKKVWHETLTLKTGITYKHFNAELAYRIAGSPFNYPDLHTRYNMLAMTLAYGFSF